MNLIARIAVWTALFASVSATHAQTLIWADEFSGPRLDPGSWTFDAGGSGFGNQELQFYTTRPENVQLEDGVLVITGRREVYEGKQFTSARLKGHGRFALRYGRIEARIRVPDLADGLWPAFWLLGDNIGQVSWPRCGEIDILEMGHHDAIELGLANRRVFSAAHWDYFGSYANYGLNLDFPIDLNLDYHVYALDWTPTLLRTYLDGVPIWTMDISTVEQNSLEEFHEPCFPVLNLAVGGINFVQITDPAQITAPFPARLEVDWVRVYDNGFAELYYGADAAETGTLGVFTETTPVDNAVVYDVDTDLFAWHNVTIGAAPPYEGASAWRFSVVPGDWFGLGVACRENRNMRDFSDGHLHLHMRTTSTLTLGIGIASSAAGEGWLDLSVGGEQFGLVRDGQWHDVVIPLNRFPNIDFETIRQLFMLRGAGQSAAFTIDVDNVYWTASPPRPTPENGNFGVYTETANHTTAGLAVLGVDQDFWIWANTLVNWSTPAFEGTEVLGFQSAPGQGWFGAAFMPRVKYNLSAFRYPQSRLHFALKTTSSQTFYIGMKSGNVDHIGQRWIRFQHGQDPYGFVRDGQWHVVEIPLADFAGVNLLEVSQLFELLGTNGPISNIAIDDVCFVNGGSALIPGAPGDLNDDGYVDVNDVARFARCFAGPDQPLPAFASTADAERADFNGDDDVDLDDLAALQSALTPVD